MLQWAEMKLKTVLGYDRLFEDPEVSSNEISGAANSSKLTSLPGKNLAEFLDACLEIKNPSSGDDHEEKITEKLREAFNKAGIVWFEYNAGKKGDKGFVDKGFIQKYEGGKAVEDDRKEVERDEKKSGTTFRKLRSGGDSDEFKPWTKQEYPFFVTQPMGGNASPDFLVHLGSGKYVAIEAKSSTTGDMPTLNNTIPKGKIKAADKSAKCFYVFSGKTKTYNFWGADAAFGEMFETAVEETMHLVIRIYEEKLKELLKNKEKPFELSETEIKQIETDLKKKGHTVIPWAKTEEGGVLVSTESTAKTVDKLFEISYQARRNFNLKRMNTNAENALEEMSERAKTEIQNL